MEQTGPKYSQFRKLEHIQENTFEFHTSFWSCRAVVLIRKSENQTRVPGSTKEGYVAFVKNHASSFKKSDCGESFMWTDVSCLLRHIEFFCILIFCCKFIFILIVVIVIELAFVPFQQLRHCLLVYFWGNHKSRGFCYPVLLSSCDRITVFNCHNPKGVKL